MTDDTLLLISEFEYATEYNTEVKALAREALELVQDEADTLIYSWYLDEEGCQGRIFERFRDSQAFFAHLANSTSIVKRFNAMCSITKLTVLGTPSPEFRQAMSAAGADLSIFTNEVASFKT